MLFFSEAYIEKVKNHKAETSNVMLKHIGKAVNIPKKIMKL